MRQRQIQLPDFQRSWVWDEDRIKSLIASVSQAFPVGALMTLEMQAGAAETFARRPVEGALKDADRATPNQLLLDGQQRMTSLYQTCMRREVVEMTTARQKLVRHWFYIDIAAALRSDGNREDAILGVPQDRKVKENFDRDIKLDLSTPGKEYEAMMFPLNRVFDWDEWQDGFGDYWIAKGDPSKRKLFQQFKQEVLQNSRAIACRSSLLAMTRHTRRSAWCSRRLIPAAKRWMPSSW